MAIVARRSLMMQFCLMHVHLPLLVTPPRHNFALSPGSWHEALSLPAGSYSVLTCPSGFGGNVSPGLNAGLAGLLITGLGRLPALGVVDFGKSSAFFNGSILSGS